MSNLVVRPEHMDVDPTGSLSPFRCQLECHSCQAVWFGTMPAYWGIFSQLNVEQRINVHPAFIQFHRKPLCLILHNPNQNGGKDKN